jgi:hypothetical protein
MSGSNAEDNANFQSLIAQILQIPREHQIFLQSLASTHSSDPSFQVAQSIMTANQEVIKGQEEIKKMTSGKHFNPSTLILDLLNMDTEVPSPSALKILTAAERSGRIEEMLRILNPDRCSRTPNDAFFMKEVAPISLGSSRHYGGVNPQEFLGKDLLQLASKDLLFSIFAAIAPTGTIGKTSTFEFTPTDKIQAYANLIRAIDEGKLRISTGSTLDQKRFLAERVLYLMSRHKIPKDNVYFEEISNLIGSGSGEKMGKVLRDVFVKKGVQTTQNKTIQKLFREYDPSEPFSLEDLQVRIQRGADNRQCHYAIETIIREPLAHAGAGAGLETRSPDKEDRLSPISESEMSLSEISSTVSEDTSISDLPETSPLSPNLMVEDTVTPAPEVRVAAERTSTETIIREASVEISSESSKPQMSEAAQAAKLGIPAPTSERANLLAAIKSRDTKPQQRKEQASTTAAESAPAAKGFLEDIKQFKKDKLRTPSKEEPKPKPDLAALLKSKFSNVNPQSDEDNDTPSP